MSNELALDGYVVSRTVTARIANAAGQFYHVASAAFETYGAGGHTAASYDVALTEKGGGAYRADWPAAITTDGAYTVYFWDSAITSQAVQLLTITVSDGAVVSLADLVLAQASGSGDYPVTLTIRTTAGSPLAGVRVWVSTDNDPDNPVTAVRVTSDGGVATFRLDYATTYYVHCHLSGYTFAAASFTPAAGSVSFTKDIAAAVSTGVAGDYATAFLVRYLALVKKKANEPIANAKYSDDYLIERAEEVYSLVLGEKQRQEQDPIVVTVEITIVDGTNDYVLPSCFGPIQAVYYNSGRGTRMFYRRGSSHNVLGKGVWVEGNLLRLQDSQIAYGETITVEAWPTGCARLHCGVCTVNAAGDEVTMGATPYKGTLDRAVNGYLGSLVRIFNVTGDSPTGNCIQERKITGHNWQTRVLTLAAALDPVPAAGSGGYIYYEIAPQIPVALDAIIGHKVAAEILAGEGLPKKASGCLDVYRENLRHLRLDAFSKQLQSAGVADADTFQNETYGGNFW